MKKKYFALPYIVWMLLFTVAPLILVFVYAFFDTSPTGEILFTSDYIVSVFSAQNMSVLLRSMWYALITTVICLVLAYPAALFLSRLSVRSAAIVSMLFMLPMWMNFLLRTYAWRSILDLNGPFNQFLGIFGIPPQQILYTEGAVILGLVYNFLPFMILPIYSVFQKLNPIYNQAAEDLGANKLQVLMRVTLPLTRPGIITGITMVFMPSVTTFIISRLLGGSHYMMYGDLIENQFMLLKDWNTGSALSVVMMILLIISMWIMRKYDKDEEGAILW